MSTKFEIVLHNGTALTRGLSALNQSELSIQFDSDNLAGFAEDLLRSAGNYATSIDVRLKPGETIGLQSWMFKLQEHSGHLELCELTENGHEFQRGCSFSASLIEQQKAICDAHAVTTVFSLTNQMVAVSDGVMTGKLPIEGVRYPSPEHMSGWWITTDDFNRNTDEIKTVHMGHIISTRPDIRCMLALPYGFRFAFGETTEIWFDQNVANSD